MLNAVTDQLTSRMPKMVSLRHHSVADKLVVAAFFVAGAFLWRRSRRAAMGSVLCGTAALALNALTNYGQNGSRRVVDPALHGKLDVALAGLTASMPEVLSLDRAEGRKFFRAQAGVITVLANLTEFDAEPPEELIAD